MSCVAELNASSQKNASVQRKKCGTGTVSATPAQPGADQQLHRPDPAPARAEQVHDRRPQRLDHPRQVEPARVERDVGVRDPEALVHDDRHASSRPRRAAPRPGRARGSRPRDCGCSDRRRACWHRVALRARPRQTGVWRGATAQAAAITATAAGSARRSDAQASRSTAAHSARAPRAGRPARPRSSPPAAPRPRATRARAARERPPPPAAARARAASAAVASAVARHGRVRPRRCAASRLRAMQAGSERLLGRVLVVSPAAQSHALHGRPPAPGHRLDVVELEPGAGRAAVAGIAHERALAAVAPRPPAGPRPGRGAGWRWAAGGLARSGGRRELALLEPGDQGVEGAVEAPGPARRWGRECPSKAWA